jgi:hypothetical protein
MVSRLEAGVAALKEKRWSRPFLARFSYTDTHGNVLPLFSASEAKKQRSSTGEMISTL